MVKTHSTLHPKSIKIWMNWTRIIGHHRSFQILIVICIQNAANYRVYPILPEFDWNCVANSNEFQLWLMLEESLTFWTPNVLHRTRFLATIPATTTSATGTPGHWSLLENWWSLVIYDSSRHSNSKSPTICSWNFRFTAVAGLEYESLSESL